MKQKRIFLVVMVIVLALSALLPAVSAAQAELPEVLVTADWLEANLE
ncbi:MAG: hypothetical protein JNJ78_05305, partial [Anaerolineae bacterium]|nr:hypothetical protein [Anaerolineae bacterium]